MIRILGAALAIGSFRLLADLCGVGFANSLVLCVAGGVLILLGLLYRDRYTLWSLKRTACDDAIKYAQKKRVAFGEPDFSIAEIMAMKRLRRRNDFAAIHRFVADSDQRLHAVQRASKLHTGD